MLNLGALVATLGVNSAGLVKAQKDMLAFEKKTQASLTRINAKLATTGAAMKKVGKSMTMYLTLPMALVGGAAVKMSMDFESSMSKIVGLVGIAREQVDQWGQDILKMAPQLGKAPKELAEALFFITSAGIRGAEAMDVLRMSAKASVSGLGETKAVADLVTSAMNAYGIQTLSASMATDVLTAAVREGKAEATALASTMGMVLPIASNMGVAFHEVGAAVAAMTRTGTSAATASMQLRQILASLLKPTQQAEEALWKMNTSSATLRKTIKEKGLLTALMDIRKLSAQYGETVMSTVFPNIRALSGVLDVMGANLEDNKKIFAELADAAGSSAIAFRAAAETFEHKWNQATVSVKTALTVFGKTIAELLIPVLEGFVEKIRKVVAWYNDLSNVQKRLVVRIGAVVMAIGPLLTILGFLIASVLPKLLLLGYQIIRMFKLLSLVILKNPLAAFGILIGGLILNAIIPYIKKTKEAATAQDDWNRALTAGVGLLESAQSIQDQMKISHTLNKRQVEALKNRISAQIKMEEDFTVDLLTELNKRLGDDKKLAEFREKLAEAESAVERGVLMNMIQDRKAFIAKDLELEHQKNANRIKALKDYLTEITKLLKSFETPEKEEPWAPPQMQMKTVPFWMTDTTDLVSMQNEQLSLAQQMADDLVDIEKDTQERLKAIRDQYAAEEQAGKMAKIEQYLQLVGNMLNSVGNLWRVQKEKELSMVGDNAKKREAIEKKYALREKAIAIAMAIINTALAITKVLGQTGVLSPFVIPLIVATGAIQIAAIAAQKFAEGGAVSGPTMGMLGEAPNISRSNPEFIGTAAQLGLDKIGGQQSINPKTVKFVIEQDQLVGILEMYNNRKNNF